MVPECCVVYVPSEAQSTSLLTTLNLLPLISPLKLAKTQVHFCFACKLGELVVRLSESQGEAAVSSASARTLQRAEA